jgi:hypothetical protein
MGPPPSASATLLDPRDGLRRCGLAPIASSGSISDHSPFDHIKVLAAGRGLVLRTPDRERCR